YLHELLYPILQGYDSVHLRADMEFGGTDQRFNLLLGREMQRQHQQEPQTVLLMPLLEGLDGVQKMSKSLDNYVALNDPADEMFGKLMSLSDELMLRYIALLTPGGIVEANQIRADLPAERAHPMAVKKEFARAMTARF